MWPGREKFNRSYVGGKRYVFGVIAAHTSPEKKNNFFHYFSFPLSLLRLSCHSQDHISTSS